MIKNVTTGGTDSRNRSTIPAPCPSLSVSPEVAAYLAAQERVRTALAEQAACLAALRALDAREVSL